MAPYGHGLVAGALLALALALATPASAAPAPPTGVAPADDDCPADQLSCGRQTPVISNGVKPFRNRDFGLTMIFPAGSQVCMGRNADTPHGFYAGIGADAGCSEDPPPRPVRVMGVYADFDGGLYRSAADSANCGRAARDRARPLRLTFPGHASVACRNTGRDGQIAINVVTRFEGVDYTATLLTTRATYAADLARFRRMLAKVKLSGEG